MKVLFGENQILEASPLVIERWIREATSPFPKDAVIKEGEETINVKDYSIDDLCSLVETYQKKYVINQAQSKRKGTYTPLIYKTIITLGGEKVMRITKTNVRIGISYSNMKNSLPKSSDLPWGEWDKDYKFLINHKGKTYLRCALSQGKTHKKKEEYFKDGKKIKLSDLPKEEADKLLTANKGRTQTVFTINVDNIIKLGGNER